jgi:hypothetical protein
MYDEEALDLHGLQLVSLTILSDTREMAELDCIDLLGVLRG